MSLEEGGAAGLGELRSWWEVPAIAHFCSLFRTAFRLPDFEIEVSGARRGEAAGALPEALGRRGTRRAGRPAESGLGTFAWATAGAATLGGWARALAVGRPAGRLRTWCLRTRPGPRRGVGRSACAAGRGAKFGTPLLLGRSPPRGPAELVRPPGPHCPRRARREGEQRRPGRRAL